MHRPILTEETSSILLCVFLFAPLCLLPGVRLFVHDVGRRWLAASFILFLPTLLVAALFLLTATPIRGDSGLGFAALVVFGLPPTLAASCVCGLKCVRAHRWALLWLVPAFSLCCFLGLSLIRIYFR